MYAVQLVTDVRDWRRWGCERGQEAVHAVHLVTDVLHRNKMRALGLHTGWGEVQAGVICSNGSNMTQDWTKSAAAGLAMAERSGLTAGIS